MSKQSYYFPHDSNARNDDRILELRASHGFEGYGIYWAIIEVLRDQTEYQFRSNALAILSIAISCEKKVLEDVFSICLETGLFVEENGYFFSESLKNRMLAYDEKKAKRIAAGRKGGKAKANGVAILKQSHSKKVAIREDKIRVDKSKEYKESSMPGKPDACEYFINLFNTLKGEPGDPTKYKLNDKVKRQLKDRIKEGYTSECFKKAILSCKTDAFHIENGLKNLTPEFITRPDKLELYLNKEPKKQRGGLPNGL